VRETRGNFFWNFSFILSPETTFERKKNAIQAFKNVPKFVDSALQEGQVRRKMTRPVNISEKYSWDFFQNPPFIIPLQKRHSKYYGKCIMILFFVGIVRIQKYFGFLSLRLLLEV